MNSKLDLSFILNSKGVQGAMPSNPLVQQNLPTQNLYYQNSEPTHGYAPHGAYKRPREESREDLEYISGLQPPIVRQRVLTQQGYPAFSVGSSAVIPTATSSIPQSMYSQQPQLHLSLNAAPYETSPQYSSQFGILPQQQQQVLPQVSLNSIQQHPQQEQILNMLINYKKPELPQMPQDRRPEEEFEVFIPPALPPLSSLLKPVDVNAQGSHAQLPQQHQTPIQTLPAAPMQLPSQRPMQQLPAVQHTQQQFDLQQYKPVAPQYQFPTAQLPSQPMSQHSHISQLPQMSHLPQQQTQQQLPSQPQYIQQYTPRTSIQPPQPQQVVYPQMEQSNYYAPPPQQHQQMSHNPNMYSAPPPSSYNMVQHSQYPTPQYQPVPQQQQQQPVYAPPPHQVIQQQPAPVPAAPQPVQAKYQSPTDSHSDGGSPAAGSSSASPNAEQKLQEHHQLQPIRILAHQIGLSKDPNKSWRYRDIKRSLFEKMTPEQEKFIDLNSEHAIIKERLPHKLSMCSFAKRIFLLVFHFIIRDGREPKFWRRQNVNHELVEEVLTKYESSFYTRVNKDIAFACYQLLHANESEGAEGVSESTDKKKLTMDQAMQISISQHMEKLHQHSTQQQPPSFAQAQPSLQQGAVHMQPQRSLPAVKMQQMINYHQ